MLYFTKIYNIYIYEKMFLAFFVNQQDLANTLEKNCQWILGNMKSL